MKYLNMEEFKKLSPCQEGYKFVLALKTTNLQIIFEALQGHNLEWANWLLARLLTRKNKVRYAIFAAEQALGVCEKECRDDMGPRRAIEAARKVLAHDTKKNRAAANAARAAYDAASATRDAAIDAAIDAASYAFYASAAAARAASAAARYAASVASYDVNAAYYAARDAMKLKIVNYGLSIGRLT